MIKPSGSDAASSKLSSAGMWAIGPLSRTQVYSACAPEPLTPKTRSPGANSVTADPTASTSPANSIPGIGRFGPAEPREDAAEERRRVAVAAVRAVDRRRAHPDEDLVVLGNGTLDVLEPQDIRRPVPVADDRSHGVTTTLARAWPSPM